MLLLEYEIERDSIELAYNEKINKFNNELRELDAVNSDLVMQQTQRHRDYLRIQATIEEIKMERDNELLKLKREYMISQEDQAPQRGLDGKIIKKGE